MTALYLVWFKSEVITRCSSFPDVWKLGKEKGNKTREKEVTAYICIGVCIFRLRRPFMIWILESNHNFPIWSFLASIVALACDIGIFFLEVMHFLFVLLFAWLFFLFPSVLPSLALDLLSSFVSTSHLSVWMIVLGHPLGRYLKKKKKILSSESTFLEASN